MPPYRQRVVAPPAQPAGCFARGAAPPLWQAAGFGSVGCPPPPCAPCAASARLGLALAAPPFSVGAWLRGGSRRGNWDSAACGRRGKDTPLGFPAHTLPYRCGKPTTLSTASGLAACNMQAASPFGFRTASAQKAAYALSFINHRSRSTGPPIPSTVPLSLYCQRVMPRFRAGRASYAASQTGRSASSSMPYILPAQWRFI